MDQYVDRVCQWLCNEALTEDGRGTMAEIIVQILQSTLMPVVLSDQNVQIALISNKPDLALNAINKVLVEQPDEISHAYIRILYEKHSELIDPPFDHLNSDVWYFQEWTVSHFNNILITL
jgi:hypothetical protein